MNLLIPPGRSVCLQVNCRRYLPSFYISIIIFSISPIASPQQLNYREIFGDNWKRAEDFLSQNREWMEPAMNKYNLSYKEAVAVIFPELIRYSALRDKIEITLLKALYINKGKDYANFSIGQFQMKPFFAEKIRESAAELSSRKLRRMLGDSTGYNDIRTYRASIVSDLEDIRMQTNYLVLFLIICKERFRTDLMDETSRVRFLSTAYNTGFYKTETEIRAMIDRKFFSTSLVSKEHYCYSDISVYWYNYSGK
jgi:hypothetical protein